MRKLLIWTALAGLALACGTAEEVVVTREQLGEAWPLEVNSARVSCSDSGTVLRLGQKRYALDETARRGGLPDAREVAPAGGDLTPLIDACEGLEHVASGG